MVDHLFAAHCDHDHPFIRGEVKRLVAAEHTRGAEEMRRKMEGNND